MFTIYHRVNLKNGLLLTCIICRLVSIFSKKVPGLSPALSTLCLGYQVMKPSYRPDHCACQLLCAGMTGVVFLTWDVFSNIRTPSLSCPPHAWKTNYHNYSETQQQRSN